MDQREQRYLKTTPSQMINLGHYIVAFLLTITVVGAIVGIPYAIWRYLVVKCTVYELTSERIRHHRGVLNKVVDELELYRVRDYQVLQPFWLRLVGCGNVVVVSADRSHGELVLMAVKDSQKVANTIRALVEKSRRARGVRDLDVGPANGLE